MNIYGVTPENNPQATYTPPSHKPTSQRPDGFKKGRRLFWFIVATGVGLVFLFIIYAMLDVPPLTEVENPQSDLSTQIYSADGKELGTLFNEENRISVGLNDISKYAVDALIATEDERFYKHSGVDAYSIPAIIGSAVTEGEVRGGSTVTMQLARNLFDKVGKKRTPIRKLKEYIVAAYIEHSFTKEEILTAYFNTVNIYGSDYGIETASARMFGKKAKDLNLQESALVVGLLKGQGYYNPVKYPERAFNRRNTVLDQMVANNYLSKHIADSVRKLPLVLGKGTGYAHDTGPAPYFREYTRNFLKEWCKKHGYDPYSDGLKIYTTIDSRMQKYAEDAVQEHIKSLQKPFEAQVRGREAWKRTDIFEQMKARTQRYKSALADKKTKAEIDKEFNTAVRMDLFSWGSPIKDTLLSPNDSLKYYAKFLESGFISIEPGTGYVKAWVGGIDYKYFKYDHVGTGKRQVGSTFKPFVYATAIDNGKLPCDVELNQPVCFNVPGKRWCPKNSDNSVGGAMTLKKGLAGSVNLITARLMKEFGPKIIANYAYQLGIESKLDEVPALCLGVTDLTVMELVGAYCSFVNKGVHIKPIFITRIEDRNGRIIEEFMPQTNTALSEEKAYLMIDMLKGVVDEQNGTANRLRHRYGFKNEIAGKTGTTQNNSDGWFVGMTPNLVSGAWVGCSEREMRFHNTALGQGANTGLPIWAIYMKKVYADKSIALPDDPFEKPQGWTSACGRYQDASSFVNKKPTSSTEEAAPTSGGTSPAPAPANGGGTTPAPTPPKKPAGSSDASKGTQDKPGGLDSKNWD